jgi:parvulin-like peptidyl-prolyl isomerase
MLESKAVLIREAIKNRHHEDKFATITALVTSAGEVPLNLRRCNSLRNPRIIAMIGLLALGFHIQPAQAAETVYKQEWTNLSGQTQDAIIANVGGQILLLSDLRRAVALASQGRTEITADGTLSGNGITSNQASEIFDRLIEQSLLEVKVKELSLQVTDSELDSEIQNFLESRQLTREEFLRLLATEGETELSHRAEFKRQLETQRFIGRVIKPLVSVSDEEVKSYYLSQTQGTPSTVEKVTLRSLMIKGKLNQPEVQSKLAEIQKKSANGESFENIVKEDSQATDAKETGGILAPKKLSEYPGEVAKALGSKPAGTLTHPIEIGSASFVFELVSRESAVDSRFTADKETWRQKLLEKKFNERLRSYLNSEREKIKIEKRPLAFASTVTQGQTEQTSNLP